MNWLARLKNERAPDTHATKATETPHGNTKGVFVGSVAIPPAPFQKIKASEKAANEPGTVAPADPDRWSWPNSEAMSGQEIDTFIARLARFTDKGLNLTDAEHVSDRLVLRDREEDHRQLCLECVHLHGAGHWRCGNERQADIGGAAMQRDLVLRLQRCNGFNLR